MRVDEFLGGLQTQTEALKDEGLFKEERVITSQQQALISVASGKQVINLCANNYLGLSNHPRVIKAARNALNGHGYGMSSVRFICGTQDVHKQLEQRLSRFLGTQDSILYSSCFDANGGLFETLLDEQDAVISDSLNHASIIDGVRLCKAKRFRYANNDLSGLEGKLKEAAQCRMRLIATDGVFSMDGIIADLKGICDLAESHDALVMVDDSHAVGFVGPNGKGSHEQCGVMDRVDIITGTMGKALGGASGGYTAGREPIISWLRQRSRPYLFSNSLAPMIAAVTLEVIDMLEGSSELREKLLANGRHFRSGLAELGFDLVPGDHAIIPVMLGDARLANTLASDLLEEGVYVIGFSYPVVPRGKARIRTQMSAGLSREQLDRAIDAFAKVGKRHHVI